LMIAAGTLGAAAPSVPAAIIKEGRRAFGQTGKGPCSRDD